MPRRNGVLSFQRGLVVLDVRLPICAVDEVLGARAGKNEDALLHVRRVLDEDDRASLDDAYDVVERHVANHDGRLYAVDDPARRLLAQACHDPLGEDDDRLVRLGDHGRELHESTPLEISARPHNTPTVWKENASESVPYGGIHRSALVITYRYACLLEQTFQSIFAFFDDAHNDGHLLS